MSEAAEYPVFVGRKEVGALESALGDGQWHGASKLAQRGLSPRLVRSIAEQNPAMMVSGNDGYRLSRFASLDEIEHTANSIASRIKKLTVRMDALRALACERDRSAAALSQTTQS